MATSTTTTGKAKMSTIRYLLAYLTAVLAFCLAIAPAASADIDISEFETEFSATQAGASSNFRLHLRVAPENPANPNGAVTGTIKDMVTEMPKGFIGDVTKFETCTMARVVPTQAIEKCPVRSVVGFAQIRILNGASGTVVATVFTVRVYRVKEYPGEAAAFAFNTLGGWPVRLSVVVDPSNGYRVKVISRNQQAGAALGVATVTMWGVPAENQGAGSLSENGYTGATFGGPLPATVRRERFTSVPARCDGPAVTTMHIASWAHRVWLDPWEASSPAPTGCEDLVFSPVFEMQPKVRVATTPSGYRAVLQLAQNLDPESPVTPNLKDAVVTLPEGVAISASTANGLAACTDEQLGLNNAEPVACPPASKIGEVSIETPVLEDAVPGDIFAAEQLSDDPASGQMFRIFIVASTDGVLVKLRGQIEVDPDTGQITTTFLDNPDLPVGRMTLDFKSGDRAPLITPACGGHSTQSSFTSWGGQSAEYRDEMTVDSGCEPKGFAPKMRAGTTNPVAGGTGEFVLAGSRTDGDQEIQTIRDIELPKGLLGDVGSVELCGDAAAQAGTCPAGSRIGHVLAAAGLGGYPVWVPEAGSDSSVSLTGPYKGAPYGLSIVVPAKAGPFDLGKVVVRTALQVDERTAQLSASIDESRVLNRDGSLHKVIQGQLPTVIKGVPLHAKQLRVIIDREGFIVNPTNCEPQQVSAVAVGTGGATAKLANRFQVGDCASLGFAPRFSARILDKGRRSTLRSFHPRTQFTVAPRAGDANIAGARVVLPSSTLLDQANIGTTCTRAQMAERNCPEASIVGYAKAWSPLLSKSVEGPVYLAANGGVRPLPDLAAVLDGEIRVVLQGEISTQRGGGKARLQNTFRVVPDAPVERFVLTIRGGKKRGLLVNSTDLCRSREQGVAEFLGQNGKSSRTALKLAPSFKGCGKVRRQAARKAARKAAARRAMR
jgi:hypothetical protein